LPARAFPAVADFFWKRVNAGARIVIPPSSAAAFARFYAWSLAIRASDRPSRSMSSRVL